MKLFNRTKHEGKLTMDELLSDDFMQYTLENFKGWTLVEKLGRALEIAKIKNICKDSKALLGIFRLMDSRFQLGEYGYSVRGNNIERTAPSIVLKTKSNPLVRLSSVFRVRIKKKPKVRGVVTVD